MVMDQGESDLEEKPLGFMAALFGGKIGKDVFILDGAATAHLVDDWVVLKDEQPYASEVKGVGNLPVVARGKMRVGGLEFSPVLRVPGLGVNLLSES
jgi:hypothetical protein